MMRAHTHTDAHTHKHSAEIIFCFSVLNPPPVSLSLGSVVSITLVLAIPPRLLCYHPFISVSHSISLPSSLCLFSLMYPLLTSPTAPSLLLLLLPDVSANFINRNKRLKHQWFANGCVLFSPLFTDVKRWINEEIEGEGDTKIKL